MSEKYKLDKEDGLKILKGAGIAAGGAILTYLLEILPNVELGEMKMVIIPIASILINAALKLIRKN